MTFTVPDSSHPRTKLADWMELSAIASPDGRVPFAMLSSATADDLNEQPQNIGDEDSELEQHILDVQSEIQSRARALGADYPFEVVPNGSVFLHKPNLTDGGSIYLFCLFLSHFKDHTIVPSRLAPRVDNRVRNLFQGCSTLAAAGYVKGAAISFGWPRPDKSQFLPALKRVYKLFGDGKPHDRPRPAASSKIKDNGVDIIAWRIPTDGLPGTHYLIGQVASGDNWSVKSVLPDAKHFHDYWFEHAPSTQAQDAMFMPYCPEPEESESNASFGYDEILKDHIQSLGYRFGVVFFRNRIAHHASEGLRLHSVGTPNIEQTNSVPPIRKWVRTYSARLRAA